MFETLFFYYKKVFMRKNYFEKCTFIGEERFWVLHVRDDLKRLYKFKMVSLLIGF